MGSDRYLYAVEYESDAERKRVEYLFNNWADGTVDQPDGLVRVTEGAAHEELYEQLLNKVPAERVSAYELKPADTDVEPKTVRVSQTVAAPVEAVESFVQYMFSKKKAGLQSAKHNEYEVYTKKGRATVSYTLTEDQIDAELRDIEAELAGGTAETAASGSDVTVEISVVGHDPAPTFLGDFFETELTNYAESQSP